LSAFSRLKKVIKYQTVRRHITEYNFLQSRRFENFRIQYIYIYIYIYIWALPNRFKFRNTVGCPLCS